MLQIFCRESFYYDVIEERSMRSYLFVSAHHFSNGRFNYHASDNGFLMILKLDLYLTLGFSYVRFYNWLDEKEENETKEEEMY